ncbi:MAG: TRAP transporter small permease, partial [Treponema sp.]|nr:TRAP transporter small permease [Treponema sp.]
MDKSLTRIAGHLEKGICYGALGLLVLLPVADALLRPFNIALPFSRMFLVRLFLVAGLFAAMLSTRGKDHISIAIVQYLKNEKLKKILAGISGLISTFMATVLFWNTLPFVRFSLADRMVAFVPDWIFGMAMSIAYGVMAIRFAGIAASERAESKIRY